MSPSNDKNWKWPDKTLYEHRLAFYRELLDLLHKQSPKEVVACLELSVNERDLMKAYLQPNSGLLKGDDAVLPRDKLRAYMLLTYRIKG